MNGAAPAQHTIFTVGHSTSTWEEFLALLGAHAVDAIADVRTVPRSARHPHFSQEILSQGLEAHGIAYRWFRPLGGLRRARPDSPHTALRHPSFRGYADHMDTPEFGRGLEQLLEWSRARRAAVMCAERLWWQCHRRLLADRLVTRGVTVVHLMSPTRSEPHRPSEYLRIDGDRLVYDALL